MDILVYWMGKNRSNMCPRWESNPRLPACKASTISTRPGFPVGLAYISALSDISALSIPVSREVIQSSRFGCSFFFRKESCLNNTCVYVNVKFEEKKWIYEFVFHKTRSQRSYESRKSVLLYLGYTPVYQMTILE